MITISIATEVVQELLTLKSLGIKVTKAQLLYPGNNEAAMNEYRHTGMRVIEIADLVRDLA